MSELNQGAINALFAHLIGIDTPVLNINYMVFISYCKTVSDGDLLNTYPYEVGRVEINDSNKSGTGKKFTFNFNIPVSSCICQTAEVTAIDATKTIVTVDSAVDFEVNNLIEIETSEGHIERSIIAISGNDITVDTALNPIIGGTLRKKITHMIALSDATVTPNGLTDRIFLTFKVSFYNNGTASLPVKKAFEILSS